jgi:hypothetical protein
MHHPLVYLSLVVRSNIMMIIFLKRVVILMICSNLKLTTQVNKRKNHQVEEVRNEKGKGVATKKGKVGGAAKLSQQIDRMCETIESRSTATSLMYRNAQEGTSTSIQAVMKAVTSLPGAEPGTKL